LQASCPDHLTAKKSPDEFRKNNPHFANKIAYLRHKTQTEPLIREYANKKGCRQRQPFLNIGGIQATAFRSFQDV
jgi:hypothetical protein